MNTYFVSPQVSKLWRRALNNAKLRNVEFFFSLEEWIKWWEDNLGPDLITKRGNKGHQYVMARNGDKGPYISNNIHLATASVNAHERKINRTAKTSNHIGRNNPKCKLTEDEVIKIFQSLLPDKELAKLYNISVPTVRDIKKRKTWTYLTKNLLSSIEIRKMERLVIRLTKRHNRVQST